MISWVSGNTVKILLLIGITVGAAASIYSMYRSVIGLKTENSVLEAKMEAATDKMNAISEQSALQTKRSIALDNALRRVKQDLVLAETRILNRNLAEEVQDDPENVTQELGVLFDEIEVLANSVD